jgi:hypothetical protein
MAKINQHSLYIINSTKFYRLIEGLSTRDFSREIDKSEGYVGLCEGSSTDHKYNSADYPLIAQKLNRDLDDITPPDDWAVSDSHEKVEKEVVSLSDPIFVKNVLEEIKASGHAEKLQDLNELYQHLSTKDAKEREVIKNVWEEFIKTND